MVAAGDLRADLPGEFEIRRQAVNADIDVLHGFLPSAGAVFRATGSSLRLFPF